jgi:hypothetical protein
VGFSGETHQRSATLGLSSRESRPGIAHLNWKSSFPIMESGGETAARGTGTVTRLPAKIENGNAAVLDALFPIAYEELPSICTKSRIIGSRPGLSEEECYPRPCSTWLQRELAGAEVSGRLNRSGLRSVNERPIMVTP